MIILLIFLSLLNTKLHEVKDCLYFSLPNIFPVELNITPYTSSIELKKASAILTFLPTQ